MFAMCGAGMEVEATKLLIISISLAFSLSFLVLLKKINFSSKGKIALIYSHLLTLLFPLVFLTTNSGCAMTCASCYTNIYSLLSLAIPSTFIISTIAGFALIPAIFVFSNRKSQIVSGRVYSFVKASSKKLQISQPKIYSINKQEPVAFSFRNFRSAVFLSVGLSDILKWKELQAVILHELAHIKQKSSALKLSTFLLKVFSPLSLLMKFHHNNKLEEEKADKLAIKIQKTDKYIKSARKKILEYEKQI